MKRKIEDGTQNNQTETVLPDYLSLAEQLDRENKYQDALILIKQALLIEPDNLRALGLHTKILALLNRYNEALEQIKLALDIAPDNDKFLRHYAYILLYLNNPDEALIKIEHALGIAPDNPGHSAIYAQVLAKLNRLDEALVEIEKAVKKMPDNTYNLNQNTQILYTLHRLADAQVVIEKALKIEPENASFLHLYAKILINLKKPTEALIPIEHALHHVFNVVNLQLYAQILVELKRFSEAQIALKDAMNMSPNNVYSLQLYAENEIRLHNFNGALVAIRQALHIEPNNDVCLQVHAQILLCLHEPKEALVEIERALDITPDNYIHLNVYAETLFQLNRPNDALAAIKKALNIEPNYVNNLQIHAEILLLLNRPNDALTEIERSLDIMPNNIYSQIVYGQILSNLNRLDDAQDVIEQTLRSSPFDDKALRTHAEILNKLKKNQSLDESINNIFISKKYFNASLPSRANSGDDDKEHTNRNRSLIKLCTFQQVKDVEQGSSPQELKPIPININKSNFTYYTKEPKLPSNATPCIFIMAGRQANALIPTPVPAPNRTILVITEEELNRVYLNNQKEQLSVLLLPERTDLLVINHLESPAYGRYDQTTLINARRVAALCVAIHLQLSHLMLMDDNIQELNCTNGALSEFRQLWAMHQPDQLLSSIITSSNRSFNSGDKNKLGSKLFLMNAVQLQQSLNFIKPEELAFFLFLPPNCSNLIMEDYYFQLLINRGLYLNNSSFNGHATLDEQTISLTRSSANKSAAKKSSNSFGAFAWLSLDEKAFVTDLLVEKLSANKYSKELINTLVSKVVDDIKKIVTNNLRHTNEYLSTCKTETLNKVTSGSKKHYKSLDKIHLWELIKKSPDLKLRQPQIDAIKLWLNEQSSGSLHAYSIATGVGKTYIKAIMAYLELACTDQPVIVITADQKLVNNLTEQFTSVFRQLNTVTQLNLSSNMIIPVMSNGNRAISQGSLAASDGFKVTQNLYVFCEDSFLKLVQDQKVEVNHASMILLDEYHCYTKTLDAAIAAVHGFVVYAGQLDKGNSCYCIDVHQDCISLFDAQGTKRLLELKPSLIFNLTQIKSMQDMATQKHPVQLNELTLLNSLQAALQQEQQKMVFPTYQQDATREIPFYWGNELSATTIKLVDHLPAVMPTERITYITPTGIYQTNQTGITQCVVTQDELMEYWRGFVS
jgi:tetratricopeptide (TPR) repeat protein